MGILILDFISVWGKWFRAIIPDTNLASTFPAENPSLVPYSQHPDLANKGFCDSSTELLFIFFSIHGIWISFC